MSEKLTEAQRNIFAYTAPGSDFPEYISVNERNGAVDISVRAPSGRADAGFACIRLTKQQARELGAALLGGQQ